VLGVGVVGSSVLPVAGIVSVFRISEQSLQTSFFTPVSVAVASFAITHSVSECLQPLSPHAASVKMHVNAIHTQSNETTIRLVCFIFVKPPKKNLF
jgi:hypothetical protein